MDDRREARAEGGRRFQREGAITAKDLDMAMVMAGYIRYDPASMHMLKQMLAQHASVLAE